ncbi:phosphopeptide-binding protein, partial [Mycobacterium kansasii]
MIPAWKCHGKRHPKPPKPPETPTTPTRPPAALDP